MIYYLHNACKSPKHATSLNTVIQTPYGPPSTNNIQQSQIPSKKWWKVAVKALLMNNMPIRWHMDTNCVTHSIHMWCNGIKNKLGSMGRDPPGIYLAHLSSWFNISQPWGLTANLSLHFQMKMQQTITYSPNTFITTEPLILLFSSCSLSHGCPPTSSQLSQLSQQRSL